MAGGIEYDRQFGFVGVRPSGRPRTVRGRSDAITFASSSPELRSAMDRSWTPKIFLQVENSRGSLVGADRSVRSWVPVSVRPAVASWSALPVAVSQSSTSALENVGLPGAAGDRLGELWVAAAPVRDRGATDSG